MLGCRPRECGLPSLVSAHPCERTAAATLTPAPSPAARGCLVYLPPGLLQPLGSTYSKVRGPRMMFLVQPLLF